MAYAVSLLVNAAVADTISACWRRLADAGISRSMLDLGYPPHVTLAVHDELDVDAAATAFDCVFDDAAPLDVTLQGFATFGPGSGVCYAALAPSPDLTRLHERVLGAIQKTCRPHYRTGEWTPHCTLATGLPDADMDRARGLLGENWQSLDGAFETADLVQFPPIVGLKRWTL